MQCMVYSGPSPSGPLLAPSTFPLPTSPELQEGEVVLQLEGATLCNSGQTRGGSCNYGWETLCPP